MASIATAHINLVRHAVTAVGGALPKAVTEAVADTEKLRAAGVSIPAPSHEEITDAVAAAILDGRDPLDDPQVRRLDLALTLNGATGRALAHTLELAGERLVVTAITAQADAILEVIVTGASAAGEVLTEAHAVIGDHDLDDHANIIRQGDNASRAWNDARAAIALLRTLDRGWVALANLVGGADTSHPVLRYADLNLERYERLGRKADPWTLVRNGHPIDYATPTVLRDRVERLTVERERRDNRAATAFGDEYRRTHGDGRRVIA